MKKILLYTGPDVEKLKPILEELEFKSMAPRILGIQSETRKCRSVVPKASQLSMFGEAQESESAEEAGTEKKTLDTTSVSYHIVKTSEERHELIQKLKEQKEFSFEVADR